MTEPVWILRGALELLHTASIAEHGGTDGLRNEDLLESALARPRNQLAYEGVTDLARLAASYGFGLARNRPFVDGNRRTAFISIGLFLALNGKRLVAEKAEAFVVALSVASGEFSEDELVSWIRDLMKEA
jgi:death-on-curing protein